MKETKQRSLWSTFLPLAIQWCPELDIHVNSFVFRTREAFFHGMICVAGRPAPPPSPQFEPSMQRARHHFLQLSFEYLGSCIVSIGLELIDVSPHVISLTFPALMCCSWSSRFAILPCAAQIRSRSVLTFSLYRRLILSFFPLVVHSVRRNARISSA